MTHQALVPRHAQASPLPASLSEMVHFLPRDTRATFLNYRWSHVTSTLGTPHGFSSGTAVLHQPPPKFQAVRKPCLPLLPCSIYPPPSPERGVRAHSTGEDTAGHRLSLG